MSEKVLIIEDEQRMRRVLQLVLESRGYLVKTAPDGENGILKWKSFQPDLVVTDLKMPKADGMAVLKHRNLKYPHTPLILLTAFGTIPTAVEAMKQGAFDYITKPVDNDVIIEKAKNALKKRQKTTLIQKPKSARLLGSSAAMDNLRKQLELVASTNTSVLITGESGTGKELAARTIQQLSPRFEKPFIRINCAAIPKELTESELFGHVKGSFTGAIQGRKGAFVEADSGTLFLDEIGDLPLELQAKLLHAVEEREITPVGSAEHTRVDVKIISATNQNIEQMIKEKKFRADLYFRLNTYKILMPRLKKRAQDIPELCEHFLTQFSQEFNQASPTMLPGGMEILSRHSWPGNVRELKNVLENLVLVSKGGPISEEMIASLITSDIETTDIKKSMGKDLITYEKKMIKDALTACGGNISKAARRLGITRNTLRYRIKKYGLEF